MRILALFFISMILASAIPAMGQSYRRSVSFEWDSIEGARSYDVELKLLKGEKENEKVFNFKTKQAFWSGKLTPAKYLMRLRARDSRGVPGVWSESSNFDVGLETVQMLSPKPQEKFQSKESSEVNIPFTWKKVGGATGYHFEISSDDGKFKIEKTVSDNRFSAKIPVAQKYTWKVSAYNAHKIESDSVASADFSLLGTRLEPAKIEKPESGFVRELKWNPSESAESYDVYVLHYNRETKKWDKFKSFENYKDTTLPFEQSWSGGKYQVLVRAKGSLRQNSPLAKQAFDVVQGSRSPAAEYTALVRKSIDRVTGWYAIASYLVTQIHYRSSVRDFNSRVNYDTVGGTGRLGAGWMSADSPWGFIAAVDMSGFSVEGTTKTFSSVEANSIYRLAIGERGDLRLQSGVFYKEVPATIRQATSSNSVIYSEDSAIKAAGPHLGAEYWYSLSPKLGFQLNAHVYMSALKLGTPNNQDLTPSMSTQIGLLGSYRITPTLTGLIGYARREERLSYKKDPNAIFGTTNSDDNITEITGNYLNFFAEWSF